MSHCYFIKITVCLYLFSDVTMNLILCNIKQQSSTARNLWSCFVARHIFKYRFFESWIKKAQPKTLIGYATEVFKNTGQLFLLDSQDSYELVCGATRMNH